LQDQRKQLISEAATAQTATSPARIRTSAARSRTLRSKAADQRGEAELKSLRELTPSRRGDVVISSATTLATVKVAIQRRAEAQARIEKLLRQANVPPSNRVLPGTAPDRQMLLVPGRYERLEGLISQGGAGW